MRLLSLTDEKADKMRYRLLLDALVLGGQTTDDCTGLALIRLQASTLDSLSTLGTPNPDFDLESSPTSVPPYLLRPGGGIAPLTDAQVKFLCGCLTRVVWRPLVSPLVLSLIGLLEALPEQGSQLKGGGIG